MINPPPFSARAVQAMADQGMSQSAIAAAYGLSVAKLRIAVEGMGISWARGNGTPRMPSLRNDRRAQQAREALEVARKGAQQARRIHSAFGSTGTLHELWLWHGGDASYETFCRRLRNGWDIEDALTKRPQG